MSKLLIKILSICALVVLLPLVVVGASLSVTEAVGCSLTVAIDGDEGSADKKGTNPLSSNVVIKVDGKVQEGNTIKVAKYSEVTVVYSGEGYNFKGWYEGEYYDTIQDEEQPVDKKAEYTFELTHDTVLTAVRDIKKYTIHYTGFFDDGVTEVELPDEVREYNESLASLSPVAHGTWGGWREVNANGDEIGTTVKFANFGSPEVTLTAKWDDVMLVRYMDGGNEMFHDTISKYEIENDEFTLPDTSNTNVKIPTGYKFLGWKNANGDKVESVEFDQNGLTLYLDKQLIVYNITVYENGNQKIADGITFDVENGFSNLAEKVVKAGYAVKSYKYKTVDYDSLDNLAKEILKSLETDIDLTVEWKLARVTLNVKFHANSDANKRTITYNDVEKTFSAYGLTRDGYRFVGLKYNDQVYNYVNGTYEGLGEDIMLAGAEEIDVTAVWESEYEAHNFLVTAVYIDSDEPAHPELEAYVNGSHLEEEPSLMQFVDGTPHDGATAKDLSDNIYHEFIGTGKVSKDETMAEELAFTGSIRISLDETNYSFELVIDTADPTLSYYKVLSSLQEKVPADVFANYKNITIAFIFA